MNRKTHTRTGKIITFYSYKGGTGRSMSLANAAWILASNGFHVLAVDWDLEAPGLHRYLHPFLIDKELSSTRGVLDMVWDFASAAMDPGGETSADWYLPYADVLQFAVSLRAEFPKGGTLDLLSAGKQDLSYSARVSSFDWSNFYERLGGGAFIEALKRNMRAEYDYILVDSRTGLSDTAGICTVQLPDIVVVGFTLNTQSIIGATAVARSIKRQRNIRILPVPMRVEDGETAKLEAGRDHARSSFLEFLANYDGPARERYWGEVEVPYRSLYAYEEILAAVGDRAHQENSVLAASERLVSVVTDGQVTELFPFDEVTRRRLLVEFERTPSTATSSDFFISYVEQDRAWAGWVAYQLEAEGYDVFLSDRDLKPGSDLRLSVERAMASSTTIALLSPAYVQSDWAQAEWRSVLDADPVGEQGRLVPVRVTEFVLRKPFLDSVFIDLVGLEERDARDRLLRGARTGRKKPARSSAWPRQHQIKEKPRFPGAMPRVWRVPLRNAGFVDREDILAQLTLTFQRKRAQVLVGLGGVGKTQIATEYAYRHVAEYEFAWWLDADDPSLAAQLDELAVELEPGAEYSDRHRVGRGLDVLRRHSDWLVIFDNADHPERILPFLPQGNGHVLITSRNASWRGHATLMEVPVFARKDSVEMIRLQVPDTKDVDAAAIATELGDLPLAVAQAAGFMAATAVSPEEYLRLLRNETVRMLGQSTHQASVVSALSISVEQLRTESQDAAEVLDFLSVFASEIPIYLLRADPRVLDESLRRVFEDDLILTRVIGTLVQRSLARRSGETLNIHRLVQTTIRGGLSRTQVARYVRQASRLLAAATPPDPVSPTNWRSYRELIPHALVMISAWKDDDFGELLIRFCWFLLASGDATGCIELGNSMAERFAGRSGEDSEDALAALEVVALAKTELGDYEEAVSLNMRILRARELLLGADHSATLATRSSLAVSLANLGRYSEALELATDTLARKVRVLGEDHPDTLTSRANLAMILYSLGRREEAEREQRAVLEARLRIFGADHPATLGTASNLAVSLANLGRYSEALELATDTLARKVRVLGEDHPDTLTSRANLAMILYSLGRQEEAEREQRAVLEARLRIFGADHPATLGTASNLAVSLANLGRYSEALELATDTLAQNVRVLGEDHPDTLTSRANLAMILYSLGRREEAEREQRAVLEARLRIFGADHPDTLTSRQQLERFVRAPNPNEGSEQLPQK